MPISGLLSFSLALISPLSQKNEQMRRLNISHLLFIKNDRKKLKCTRFGVVDKVI
jgi:hypothetical protein